MTISYIEPQNIKVPPKGMTKYWVGVEDVFYSNEKYLINLEINNSNANFITAVFSWFYKYNLIKYSGGKKKYITHNYIKGIDEYIDGDKKYNNIILTKDINYSKELNFILNDIDYDKTSVDNSVLRFIINTKDWYDYKYIRLIVEYDDTFPKYDLNQVNITSIKKSDRYNIIFNDFVFNGGFYNTYTNLNIYVFQVKVNPTTIKKDYELADILFKSLDLHPGYLDYNYTGPISSLGYWINTDPKYNINIYGHISNNYILNTRTISIDNNIFVIPDDQYTLYLILEDYLLEHINSAVKIYIINNPNKININNNIIKLDNTKIYYLISKSSTKLNLDNFYNLLDLNSYPNTDDILIKYKHKNYIDFLENKNLSLRLQFEKDKYNYINPLSLEEHDVNNYCDTNPTNYIKHYRYESGYCYIINNDIKNNKPKNPDSYIIYPIYNSNNTIWRLYYDFDRIINSKNCLITVYDRNGNIFDDEGYCIYYFNNMIQIVWVDNSLFYSQTCHTENLVSYVRVDFFNLSRIYAGTGGIGGIGSYSNNTGSSGGTGSKGGTGNIGRPGCKGGISLTPGYSGSVGNSGSIGNTGGIGRYNPLHNSTGNTGNIGGIGNTGSASNIKGNIGGVGGGHTGGIGGTGKSAVIDNKYIGNTGNTGGTGKSGKYNISKTGSIGGTGNTGDTGHTGYTGGTGSINTNLDFLCGSYQENIVLNNINLKLYSKIYKDIVKSQYIDNTTYNIQDNFWINKIYPSKYSNYYNQNGYPEELRNFILSKNNEIYYNLGDSEDSYKLLLNNKEYILDYNSSKNIYLENNNLIINKINNKEILSNFINYHYYSESYVDRLIYGIDYNNLNYPIINSYNNLTISFSDKLENVFKWDEFGEYYKIYNYETISKLDNGKLIFEIYIGTQSYTQQCYLLNLDLILKY